MRQVALILSILFVFAAILITLPTSIYAQSGPSNPTEQQMTIDAIVQGYFQQTATAQAQLGEAEPNSLTATAQFNASVQNSFNQALTATASNGQSGENTITAKLATNQNANIRECPSTECQVVGSIRPNEDFMILLQEGEWFLIQWSESQILGYIYSPLVVLPPDANVGSLPTLTPSPAPTNTPLPPMPTPDAALTATYEALGEMVQPKGNGYYLVGIDILPGKWESTGKGSGCYWERLDQYGEIEDNSYGNAGGTVTVQESDYQIHFDDCGTWVYVEGREKVLSADATEPKGDGFYTVGVEIAPGRWRSQGKGSSCYWQTTDEYQEINANHYGQAGGAIYIYPSDYEVEFEDCGTWEYLGQ